MIAIEGIVTSSPRARELGRGNMSLHFTMSPWRRMDSTDNEAGTVIVTVESDLDYVDAWMRDLGPGDCIRVNDATLGAPDENGNVQALAVGEPMELLPPWSGASN
jgi:hypothetical protein